MINSIENGLGSNVEKCQGEEKMERECFDPSLSDLREVLSLTTLGSCLAQEKDFSDRGIKIPPCPHPGDEIRGLDNRYPSSGIFAVYTGSNDNLCLRCSEELYEREQSWAD